MLNAILAVALTAAQARAADHAPQAQLRPMLKITWAPGVDLPQGFQDSDGGFIGDTLITVAGFCSGLEADNQKKPGRYPRGFLTRTWALDVGSDQKQWATLPDWPGAARQGLFSITVDGSLYLWGGFSYSAPFCYADGWRLSRRDEQWRWEQLQNLPWKLCSAGACVIGSKIYVFGGADYDGEKGFYTQTDRSGGMARLGARLVVYDLQSPAAGWTELPQCPGTPRFVHAVQAVDGKLYVIGGATGEVTRTVVDNWTYDPPAQKWTRLRDLPVSSGNFPKSSNLVYAGRYIVLPGGHQYDEVANPDGTVRPKYGIASRRNSYSGLHNDCFVYDVKTDTFGTADPLPIDNNLPMSVVRGDEIFLIGGETGGGGVAGTYYGHHPELLLRGKIQRLQGGD